MRNLSFIVRPRLAFLLMAAMSAHLYARTITLRDYPSQGPYIDTIRLVMFEAKDAEFFRDGEMRDVKVLPDDDDAEFTYKVWMQEKPAPLVFILTGMGGHCASAGPTAFAEFVYNAGFSTVLISGAFGWDFTLNASTAITPGYTPRDSADTYTILKAVVNDLTNEYGPAAITEKILTGYSLGALHALFVSDIDQREGGIGFARCVPVSPPVNLFYVTRKLDEFYDIWQTWDEEELQARKNRAVNFYRVLVEGGELTNEFFPFDPEEAQFAIAYVYRRSLSETIKAIHQRKDFGILNTAHGYTKRHLDKEIERFGFRNYLGTFVRKSYSNLWREAGSLRAMNAECSMPAIQESIAANTNITVFHAADDMLLTDYDRKWLSEVLGDRLIFFDHGGHLGYLCREDAQKCIVDALKGLPVGEHGQAEEQPPATMAAADGEEEIVQAEEQPPATMAAANGEEELVQAEEQGVAATMAVTEVVVSVEEEAKGMELPRDATGVVLRVTVDVREEAAQPLRDADVSLSTIGVAEEKPIEVEDIDDEAKPPADQRARDDITLEYPEPPTR